MDNSGPAAFEPVDNSTGQTGSENKTTKGCVGRHTASQQGEYRMCQTSHRILSGFTNLAIKIAVALEERGVQR